MSLKRHRDAEGTIDDDRDRQRARTVPQSPGWIQLLRAQMERLRTAVFRKEPVQAT